MINELLGTDSYMLTIFNQEGQKLKFRLLQVDEPFILEERIYVSLDITSDDVIHSWAVPCLGIKVDACPGRVNEVTFLTPKPGRYFDQCSELCGINHSFMPIEIEVRGHTFQPTGSSELLTEKGV